MTQTTIHDQAYDFYTWQQAGDDTFELSKKILSTGKKFDRVLALAKGGLTFARTLVDYLGVKELSSIQIEFYADIAQTQNTPVIIQSLPVSVKDERVLIFDDIVDTGGTLELATTYLKQHGAKSITTASLITKPWTTTPVDFSVRSTKAWVIFPHETREMIELLSKNWKKRGDSAPKIKQQLSTLGFSQEQIALFANLK